MIIARTKQHTTDVMQPLWDAFAEIGFVLESFFALVRP